MERRICDSQSFFSLSLSLSHTHTYTHLIFLSASQQWSSSSEDQTVAPAAAVSHPRRASSDHEGKPWRHQIRPKPTSIPSALPAEREEEGAGGGRGEVKGMGWVRVWMASPFCSFCTTRRGRKNYPITLTVACLATAPITFSL